MTSAISCQISSIGEILRSGGKLIVPPFQRNYSWDEDNYADLWMDIHETILGNASEYFLGSVVIDNSTSPDLTLIDGQQRVTTTSILICALRWHLLNAKLNQLAVLVTNDFLIRADYDQKSLQPNLELNRNNREFFNKYLITATDPADLRAIIDDTEISPSNMQLAKCYIFMGDQIGAMLKNERSLEKVAQSIITALREKVFLIRIDVENDIKAFTLFEALNNRGVELSEADLVKNYIFSKSGNHLETMSNNWEHMTSNIANTALMRFFRRYWISNYGVIPSHGLLTAIKNRVNSADDALDFSNQITICSDYYGALIDPTHELWDKLQLKDTDKIKQVLSDLSVMRAEQCYILALAVLEKIPNEFLEYITMIRNFTFRYSTISGRSTSQLQRAYMHSAHLIRNNEQLTATQTFGKFFSDLYPQDNQFQSLFSKKSIKVTALARYILSEINKNLTEANNTAPNTTNIDTDLEHILPKKFKDHWQQHASKFPGGHSKYINRLGNMTLITPDQNRRLGNADFETKKQVYAHNCLNVTERLLEEPTWSAEAISRRQNWLASEAIKIWRFPLI